MRTFTSLVLLFAGFFGLAMMMQPYKVDATTILIEAALIGTFVCAAWRTKH